MKKFLLILSCCAGLAFFSKPAEAANFSFSVGGFVPPVVVMDTGYYAPNYVYTYPYYGGGSYFYFGSGHRHRYAPPPPRHFHSHRPPHGGGHRPHRGHEGPRH